VIATDRYSDLQTRGFGRSHGKLNEKGDAIETILSILSLKWRERWKNRRGERHPIKEKNT
jgi:hypothetical protein